MKPILITGTQGFIGRNLTQFVVKQGVPVVGIGHGSLPKADIGDMGLKDWLNGDVDFANLQQLANRHGEFSHIFHLAGGSHVGRSYQNPAEDFQRTVTAGGQLLEWTRLNNPDANIVVVSSAAVYGAGHEGNIRELDAKNPFSPYGAHKLILETLCRSYCENFGLRIAITRLFSVYGEGLEKQLVFDLCQKLSKSQNEIELGGTGTELRDWLHVSDVARLLWLIKDRCGTDCFTVNGGSGLGMSVAQIASGVAKAWGCDPKLKFSGDSRRGDPKSLVANVELLRESGFNSEISLEDGFKRVVDWYKSTWI